MSTIPGADLEEREQALREALAHPKTLPFLSAMLELERREAAFKPGSTFEHVAYHGGRVSLLEDLIHALRQLR